MNGDKLIISVFDYSGNFVKNYIDNGYPVILWDYKVEGCILEHFDRLIRIVEDALEANPKMIVYGIVLQPPCTAYTVSGAWTWPDKDAPTDRYRKSMPGDSYEIHDCFTDYMDALAEIGLFLVDLLKPKFWVLENPVGRIEKRVPTLQGKRQLIFNPCDYGDPYTKKTILWGDFNNQLPKTPVEPIKSCSQGSWLQKLGGKSERTKELRSMTPPGFAKAFYLANQ